MPAPLVPAADAARQRAIRKRRRRRILFAIWAVPLVLLTVALYLAFGPKPPPPLAPLPVSPQEVAVATRHVDTVRQALTQPALPPAPQSVRTAGPGRLLKRAQVSVPTAGTNSRPVTLSLSQADLNAYISGNRRFRAAMEAKGVHNATVTLIPPNDITVRAAATFRGFSGNALVTAALTPDPRTALHFDVIEARLGRFPPPVIRAAARAVLSRLLGSTHRETPVTVQSVRVIGTDLVITETHKPVAATAQ